MALLGLEQLVGCSVPSWVFSTVVTLFLKGREGKGSKEASGSICTSISTFIHGEGTSCHPCVYRERWAMVAYMDGHGKEWLL